MAILKPFRAFRPRPESVSRVASPPYDVIDTREAREMAKGNPDSFLHVSRPEIDLPEGTDDHASEVYAQGKKNLDALVASGALIQDEAPRFYVYAQTMGSHRQVGLVACASVAEYDAGLIKKHENTRADKEDDRTQHIDVLGAHDEPVFLTYRKRDEIDELVSRVSAATPTYNFTTDDGVRHTLWIAGQAETEMLKDAFELVPALYVADGHHRSAAASRVHRNRKGSPGEHDVFLAVLFPDVQMQIMAYNRVVKDPKGRSREDLLAAFGAKFDIVESGEAVPEEPRTFGLYLGDTWRTLRVRPGSYREDDPVASLDCSICQDQILAPLFGIEDPRRDKRVDFVGGIRGAKELERRVREEGFAVGIHMYPTQIAQLLSVSDSGLLMPPKSTWFEPKLRSGLFLHMF